MRTGIAIALALLVGAPTAGAETVEVVVDASAGVWRRGSDGRPMTEALRRVLLATWCRLAEIDDPPELRLRWMGGTPDAASDGCLETGDTVALSLTDPATLAEVYDLRRTGGPRPLVRSIETALAGDADRVVVVTTGLDSCGLRLTDLREAEDAVVEIVALEVRPGGAAEIPEGLAVRTPVLGAVAVDALAAAVLGGDLPKARGARLSVTLDGANGDGTVVAAFDTLGGDPYELYRRRDGRFTVEVPPGLYRIEVTTGDRTWHVVDVAAPSDGSVELAIGPPPAVDLETRAGPLLATATEAVRVWGAAGAPLWLTVVPPDAPPDSLAAPVRLAASARDAELQVPDLAGPAELRALLALPGGPRRIVATAELLVRPATAEIEAPERSEVGTPLEVAWSGPGAPGDRVVVVPVDEAADAVAACRFATGPAGAVFTTPAEPGAHEVRYLSGLSWRAIARAPLEVFEILARLEAPASVEAAAQFEVAWEGPGGPTDFLTVVRPDAPEASYRQLVLAAPANPASLRAPDEPGAWEIRYVDGATGETFGRAPLEVEAALPSLDAPAEVRAGDRFEVAWSGPDRAGDLVVVARADAPDRRWEEFGSTAAGSPLGLAAPFRPGRYEIRYVDGASGEILARRPLEVR